MDLVQFVRDRLDEEAEAATKAGGDAWRFDAVDSAGGVVFDSRDRPIMESASDPGRSHAHDRTAADHHQAAHAVRHNPARVLADIDAKRGLLGEHASDGGECRVCARPSEETNGLGYPFHEALPFPCRTIRLLALPYADHPGYRGEWRP